MNAKQQQHTPGPWNWVIHDLSMASIEGPQGMEDHVLSVSPCRSCQSGATEWEFGRCTTPTRANAILIAAAPDLLVACEVALNDRMFKDWPKVATVLKNASCSSSTATRRSARNRWTMTFWKDATRPGGEFSASWPTFERRQSEALRALSLRSRHRRLPVPCAHRPPFFDCCRRHSHWDFVFMRDVILSPGECVLALCALAVFALILWPYIIK